MNIQWLTIVTYLISSAFVAPASADEFEVDQLKKEFSKATLEISKGDSVKFTNKDEVFHNVFSLSDVQTFDLGSYPQGDSKTVVFDAPGTVEVE